MRNTKDRERGGGEREGEQLSNIERRTLNVIVCIPLPLLRILLVSQFNRPHLPRCNFQCVQFERAISIVHIDLVDDACVDDGNPLILWFQL